eukprot:TRINITY_DN1688_c0_g1_i4.p1 TRINITY_DN1688_c0_g1~~TRINITY_DN1688_c0_g1_i4.p1  ORF type:complete len:547 (-),score=151.53 TRINITY_DN1688_c0_g1_i4:153-1793(-)
MDRDHEQHVYNSVLARFDALTLNRWLKAKYDLSKAGTQDLADAAAEVPTLVAEHQSIRAVLRQLYPDAAGSTPLRGVASLSTAVVTLERRLAALQAAMDSSERHCAPQRPRANDTAAAVALVFASDKLLADVVAFVGPEEFLFVAPVSRYVRAVYTGAAASLSGAACRTVVTAAFHSAARLEYALDTNVAFADALRRLTYPTPENAKLGQVGSAALVRRTHAAGLAPRQDVLIGAARTGSVGYLHSVWSIALARCDINTDTWYEVGLELAKRGDDGAGLAWVAAQLRPPETWPEHFMNALCNTAAKHGRITTLRFLLSPDHGQLLFGPPAVLSLDYCISIEESSSSALTDEVLWSTINGKSQVTSLVHAAAMHRDARALAWLQSELPDFTLTERTVHVAAFEGALATLEWLRAQGCPYNIADICNVMLSCDDSVAPRHLEWLRSCGGGDWSPRGMTRMLVKSLEYSTDGAAKWLRRKGAPWPDDLAATVNPASNMHTVLWAVQSGCPFGHWSSSVCARLRTRYYDESAAVILALHDLGCPCDCPRP